MVNLILNKTESILSRLPFYFFEQRINPTTVSNQHMLVQWAKDNYDNKIHGGSVTEDVEITNLKIRYCNYFEQKKLVFFIQLPTAWESPGGFSLFWKLN